VNGGWILATRADDELTPIAAALATKGIRVIGFPVLREEPVQGPLSGLDAAIDEAAVVAFTSRRAPGAMRHGAGGALWSRVVRLPAAAVGPATAAAARREGFDVGIVGEAGGASLGAALLRVLGAGDRVLHPCGREHRDELERVLAGGGVRVLPLVVYVMADAAPETLPPLPDGRPLGVFLTSPRAARAYLRASGGRFAGVPHVALGATTAAAAAEEGIAAHAPASATTEAVLEELCRNCS
jgi:uroporphyrinogen-III synthase